MSADSLSTTSRGFYERSKAKLTISLVLGAASMMLLGFCADAGGQAASIASIRNYLKAAREIDGSASFSKDTIESYNALIAGYDARASTCKVTPSQHAPLHVTSTPSLLLVSIIPPPLFTLGFGSFVYILGFILLAASAIYTSPLICGTADETKIMKSPQEINGGGGAGYAPEPYNRAAPTGGV